MPAKDTMVLNINDEVDVRLTPEGVVQYNKFYQDLARKGDASYGKVRPPLRKDRGGWYTFQLWDLMNIFGPNTYLGGPQYFADNEIRIKKK